jgi:hypothetical protein
MILAVKLKDWADPVGIAGAPGIEPAHGGLEGQCKFTVARTGPTVRSIRHPLGLYPRARTKTSIGLHPPLALSTFHVGVSTQ